MALPPLFVEFVCGPPGSGKTTYCEAKRQLLVASSKDMDADANADRHLIHCNLDPANDGIFPYPCVIDICDLIEVKTVAEQEKLGPNGSYLFCVDYISQHTDWIMNKMKEEALKCMSNDRNKKRFASAGGAATTRPVWFLMDCPGQVEFYVHSSGLAQLVRDFTKILRCNVCLTHLCDAAIATRDVFSYVSTCLLCLTSMTDIELPQVNVLTKWDRAFEQAKESMPLMKRARREPVELNRKLFAAPSLNPQSGSRRKQQGDSNETGSHNHHLHNNANNNSSNNNNSNSRTKDSHNDDDDDDDDASDGEVEEWLEPFLNTQTFSSEHFDQMWRDTQMEMMQKAQESQRKAMIQRCSPGSSSGGNKLQGESTSKGENDTNENTGEGPQQGQEQAPTRPSSPPSLKALTKSILGVIEGYNLVGYSVLDVQNGEMMQELCMEVDNAVGFAMQSYQ